MYLPSHSNGRPFPISGYILAGGRSSRMGTDKALLQLAGKPLIQHAVAKLRRTCADVRILSSNPALAAYAPLVPDIHPGCGPVGGMEAALAQSEHDWNLFLAVDLPFLPSAFIYDWTRHWLLSGDDGARIRFFSDQGRPHPTFGLLHQDVLPFLSLAITSHNLKLIRVLEDAGRALATSRGNSEATALWSEFDAVPPPTEYSEAFAGWRSVNPAQRAARRLWFANLNTPEDFAVAAAHSDVLDT